jgi:hypothetical protein
VADFTDPSATTVIAGLTPAFAAAASAIATAAFATAAGTTAIGSRRAATTAEEAATIAAAVAAALQRPHFLHHFEIVTHGAAHLLGG